MKKFYHSFLIAFSMYSKIPMPQCEWNEENMAYAMCFFPWVGVAIGGVTWLWGTFGARLGLSAAFYTVILTLIPWLITGGIHLDGLLDTADAMSSWQERDRRLEILKDSNSGAFAVITCVVYFLFYYGVYSQISTRALAMIPFTFCLSRTLSESEEDGIGISDGTRSEGSESEGYDVCVSGGAVDRDAAGGLEGWTSGVCDRRAGLCALLSECDEIFWRNYRGLGWVLFVAL